MKQTIIKWSSVALFGACFVARPAMAIVVPIASMVEWPQEIMLLFESEIKRWEHEAIKYKELLYTDMIGKKSVKEQGKGSLGESAVITELKDHADKGASSIQATAIELKCAGGNKLVDDLTDYKSAKSQLEANYVIQRDKWKKYTEADLDKIEENQRVAVNELAKTAIAMSAIENVVDTSVKAESEREKRAQDISNAKDVNAMYELMVGMDQRIYEKSLRTSNLDATDAALRSMQTLQGLAKTNPDVAEEEQQ